MILTNTDKESVEIIPHLTQSIKGKLSLFMWGTWQAKFLPGGGSEAVVAKELPFFLAWLREWKPPGYVLANDPRYMVNSYHHPKMLEHAYEASSAARLDELMQFWREQGAVCAEAKKAGKKIWATPTKLRNYLTEEPSSRDALREFSRQRMAAALEELNLPTRKHGPSTDYLIFDPSQDHEDSPE